MSNSLNLGLPYVQAAQAQKHVTVNDAFRRIDSIVQLGVVDRTRTSPPATPAEGDRHIVASPSAGAWAGHELNVAAYADGAWVFFEPQAGWLAFIEAEAALLYFDGASWEILTTVDATNSVATLGVNANADTTNRLAVQSPAALFTADTTQPVPTGDVRIIANKTASGDVASHLFQTGFSGRAEFGLIGSDDFSLKVSGDGSNFAEAFTVDRTSGRLDFSRSPSVGGTEAFAFSVSSRSALAGTVVPADVSQVETRGFSSENDGGGGRYERVFSPAADGLGVTDAAGGHWALEGETVTARQAGATGNGATDDTAALNLALASGRTVLIDKGTFYVTDALTTGASGQRVLGDGRIRSVLKVDAAFNMSAAGVFVCAHHNVDCRDFAISFDQSSAADRASLVQYPVAVNLVDFTRVRMTGLRFLEAYDGIDATGNTGGAIFTDIECGSLNEGFRFGGALDSIELNNCRVWPYTFAGDATLMGIYSDGNTVGFRLGRVDDLKLSNCTPFRAKVIIEETAGAAPFGIINGLALDGANSSIEMHGGEFAITSLYATTNVADDPFIVQTGGDLTVSDFSFRSGSTSNVPMVHVNGTAANLHMENGRCELGSGVASEAFRLTEGQLSISGIRFAANSETNRTGAIVNQIGGTLSAFGNSVNGLTTGSGTFIKVATDSFHTVVGNSSSGRPYEFPAVRSKGVYGPNHDGTNMRMDAVLTLGAVNATTEGGELRLEGAGTNATVIFDTVAGNARVSGLDAGGTLDVIASDGTARISGTGLSFTGGLKLDRGLGDDGVSVAVGAAALGSTTSGSGNTMLGHSAGQSLTSGDNNTGVGRNALSGAGGGVSNSTALGNGATVTGSNQVQLGNSFTTTYAYGAVQNRSDARDKADVRDTALGLSFLRALRPVDFRWDYREDYVAPQGASADWEQPEPGSMARSRYHHGFLAQEVARVAEEAGIDFGGYQDHALAGGADVKSIGYSELLAPVVKAIQELADRVDALADER